MTAEDDQTPDDGRLPRAGVPDDDGPPALVDAALFQDLLQADKQPITAHKGRLRSNAGHFKQERLQHDVGLL